MLTQRTTLLSDTKYNKREMSKPEQKFRNISGLLWRKEAILWRKRYCVLKGEENKLYFFERENQSKDPSKCLGFIDFEKTPINDARLARDNFGYTRKEEQWGFQINTEERSHAFMAITEKSMNDWLAALNIYKDIKDNQMIQKHQEKFGSFVLGATEIAKIVKNYQYPLVVKGLGFVEVYYWEEGADSWTSASVAGAVVLTKHDKTNAIFLQFKDPENQETLLVEKLDHLCDYGEDSDYYHSFKRYNSNTRIGLSFCSVAEAKMFLDCVQETLASQLSNTSESNWLQGLTSTLHKLTQSSSSSSSNSSSQQQQSSQAPPAAQNEGNNNNNTQQQPAAASKSIWDRLGFGNKDDESDNAEPIVISEPSNFRKVDTSQTEAAAALQQQQQQQANQPSKEPTAVKSSNSGQGFLTESLTKISGFFSNLAGDSDEEAEEAPKALDISGPTNVKHEGHMGLSKEGKLETSLPSQFLESHPEWKTFLLGIGVNSKDLEDEKVVQEIISEATDFLKKTSKIEDNSPSSLPQRPSRLSISLNAQNFREQRRSMMLEQKLQISANSAPDELTVPDFPPPPPPAPAPPPPTAPAINRPLPTVRRDTATAKPAPKDLLEAASAQQKDQLKDHLINFLQKRRQDLHEEEEDDD